MKTILFVATTLAIAVSTIKRVDQQKIESDSIDSLLAKSKVNFTKANSSIKVAEKVQKENFETIKAKITELELENKTLIQKIENYEDSIIPVIDSSEPFSLFPSN
jgi:seryl-tRNA synthetase